MSQGTSSGHRLTDLSARVLQLPERVDQPALEAVASSMAHVTASAFVLDFGRTLHIDFRALRTFVHRVRRLVPSSRPIVLAGLNPYCEEIVRFALSAGDWDFFLDTTGEENDALPRGNGEAPDSNTGRGWVRDLGLGALEALYRPCPN